jgi:hypothetical protein
MNSIDDSLRVESSEKKAYEPPRAMRLGEMKSGAGACYGTGSGDGDICEDNGNSASGIGCYGSGNNGPQ